MMSAKFSDFLTPFPLSADSYNKIHTTSLTTSLFHDSPFTLRCGHHIWKPPNPSLCCNLCVIPCFLAVPCPLEEHQRWVLRHSQTDCDDKLSRPRRDCHELRAPGQEGEEQEQLQPHGVQGDLTLRARLRLLRPESRDGPPHEQDRAAVLQRRRQERRPRAGHLGPQTFHFAI